MRHVWCTKRALRTWTMNANKGILLAKLRIFAELVSWKSTEQKDTKIQHLSAKKVDRFPNATVLEYGKVSGYHNMKAEIYARGPIACSLNAGPIANYTGGIVNDPYSSKKTNHVVSIVGWGVAADGIEYWRIRNSWGEYYGHMGFLYLKAGENQLGVESSCAWATPGVFTDMQSDFGCHEDGTGCNDFRGQHYYLNDGARTGVVGKLAMESKLMSVY